MKKKKKPKVKQVRQRTLENKLWALCKIIIRKRYGNTCYTCGADNLVGSNWHTGHMWPKATLGAMLKYDLRVLRPQCYRCNILYGGMGAVFYAKMLAEIGQKEMDELMKQKKIIVKASDFYQIVIPEYEKIAKTVQPLVPFS